MNKHVKLFHVFTIVIVIVGIAISVSSYYDFCNNVRTDYPTSNVSGNMQSIFTKQSTGG